MNWKKINNELRLYRENLEKTAKEKTAELNIKIEDLEKFNRVFVERELRMIEIKRIIMELQDDVYKIQ